MPVVLLSRGMATGEYHPRDRTRHVVWLRESTILVGMDVSDIVVDVDCYSGCSTCCILVLYQLYVALL